MMADQSAKFWDNVAERYSRRPVADEAAYQKKLAVTRGYFRPDSVERMIREHTEGSFDHAYRLWALLILELWHREWVDGGPAQ